MAQVLGGAGRANARSTEEIILMDIAFTPEGSKPVRFRLKSHHDARASEAPNLARTPEPNRHKSWHHRIRERYSQFGKTRRPTRQLRRSQAHGLGWDET